MKYRLYENSTNNVDNIVEDFFKNRGIDNYEEYMNLTDDAIQDYDSLNNIFEARDLLLKHINNENKIGILIDEDVDGFCSAAMMYLYLQRICDENWYSCEIEYIMHTRPKAHGLSKDITINKDVDLLIIPDEGTNDINQCQKLVNNGTDVIIIDHHESEHDVDIIKDTLCTHSCIIVNNQMSNNYNNKDLCGAGVVYQFLRCMDDYYEVLYANDYLDLCALANISDVMDIRSFETKRLIDIGLNNINNKCFKAFIEAQDYSMKGIITIHNVQWYITPLINGMVRCGELQDKELLFRAFIETGEYFDYEKRATKSKPKQVIQESIYDRAVRLCKNAKSKQDRMRNKMVPKVLEKARLQPKDDKVLLIDVTDILDSSLTGLVAIKVAEEMNKPSLLLQRRRNSDGDIVLSGSARNMNNSPLLDFKSILNDSNQFIFAQGHPNAFGCELNIDNVENAKNALNDILSDVVYDPTYIVDFIADADSIDMNLLRECSDLNVFYGQKMPDIQFAIENIYLDKEDIDVVGKNLDTLKFSYNEISFVQFKCKNENKILQFVKEDFRDGSVKFNAVCEVQISYFNNIKQYECVVKDIDVINIEYKDDNDMEHDEW